MMTPAALLSNIRFQCAETADNSFWPDDEIYDYMWMGEIILAQKIKCTRTTDSSITTVSGTREYSTPSGIMTIERITWDSARLNKISVNDIDDLEGLSYGSTGQTGQPTDYYIWGTKIGLSPIPDSAKVLKIYHTARPAEITVSSTAFTVPAEYGNMIADYCLYRMYLKDEELKQKADTHFQLWQNNLEELINNFSDREYRDQNIVVKDMGA